MKEIMKKTLKLIFVLLFYVLLSGENNMKIISRYDYYTNEKEGTILVVIPSQNNFIDIIYKDNVLIDSVEIIPGKLNFISFPIENFSIGKNEITCKLRNKEEIQEIRQYITILTGKTNEVKIDRATGGLIVDGLPFFPFGFYCYSPVQETLMEEEVVKGFNMISPYQQIEKKSFKERKKYMDRCAALGMKVNYNLCSVAGGGGAGSDRQEKSDDELEKLLIEEVNSFKNHPALLSWYISDEPVLQGMSIEKLRKVYDTIKQLDPYHPVSIVFMKPQKSREYTEALDIIMADPYPIPEHNILDVGNTTGNLTKEFFLEKSVWIVPQAFGGGEHWKREPTKQELRMISYHAVINQAVGVQYFVRHGMNSFPKSTTAWAECGAIALEVAELTPYLLSGEEGLIIHSSDPDIKVRSFRKGDRIIILAVNTANEPKEMTISLEDAKYSGKAELIFENRSIRIKEGKFTEFIDAYGTRCYKLLVTNEPTELPKLEISPLNVLLDPGFENNPSVGVPAACYAKCNDDRGATFFIDSRISVEGEHSLRLTTPSENEGMKLKFFPVYFREGHSFTFSIRAKAGNETFSIEDQRGAISKFFKKLFKLKDRNRKTSFSVKICGQEKTFFLTENWQEYSFVLEPLGIGRISTTVIELLGTGTAWFDLIQVVDELSIHHEMKDNRIFAEIKTKIDSVDIRYTLDGSEPVESSALYSEAIPIDRSCVVKASVFKEDRKIGLAKKDFFIHKAIGKKIKYLTEYRKYTAGGKQGLVNGLFGGTYHRSGRWRGYKGNDVSLVLDMEEITKIDKVTFRFLEKMKAWIFLPDLIEISISDDDDDYELIASFSNQIPDGYKKNEIREFTAELPNRKTRYIKLFARNMGKCPDWHNGAGDTTWIFTDEIVVE